MKDKKQSSGEIPFLPLGMSIGLSIGVALGAIMQNIPLFMCLGLSVGVAIGAALDAKRRNEKENAEKESTEE